MHIFVHYPAVMYMGVSRCFPWLSRCHGGEGIRVSDGEKRDGFGTLPDDVVVEVLSRLDVDQLGDAKRVCRRWRALIATAHFAGVNFQRAPSGTLVYALFDDPRLGPLSLFLLDWGSMEKKRVGRAKAPALRRIAPFGGFGHLLGSCDGMLLYFSALTSVYEIRNHVTKQEISLQLEGKICGFFLHSLSNKYRLLSYREAPDGFCYCVVGPGRAAGKDVGTFPYRPRQHEAPSGVEGCLHWMVVGKEGTSAPCSHSIMVFSTGESVFRFMPHPGGSCRRSELHLNMHVVEMKGHVYVYANRFNLMTIWVMEDHACWQWAKKCVIDLHRELKWHPVPGLVSSFSGHRHLQLKDIGDGELLLFWPDRAFFRYNLQSGKMEEVEWRSPECGLSSRTSRMLMRAVIPGFKRNLTSLRELPWV